MKTVIRSIGLVFLSILFFAGSTGFYLSSHQCEESKTTQLSFSFLSGNIPSNKIKCNCDELPTKQTVCQSCKPTQNSESKSCCHTNKTFLKLKERYLTVTGIQLIPICIDIFQLTYNIELLNLDKGNISSFVKIITKPPKIIWGKQLVTNLHQLKISLLR